MPAKNARKQYISNGYYHLYNRGVEKRIIFLDKQDYSVFLSYLKEYLLIKDSENLREQLARDSLPPAQRDKILKRLRLNNFADSITLLSYALMPNHFHFFIKQTDENAIDAFMNSLGTRYTMYFNKKYQRVGKLYQGVYKAVSVVSEAQFLHLSRYIHRQALILQGDALQEKYPCSYYEFLGKRQTEWVKPDEILSYFSDQHWNLSYEAFMKQRDEGELQAKYILEDYHDLE